MKSCAIVVIGHVDHGKTALVRALTGTDTDRLDAEKRRGLSIVPGFAHRTYPTGVADFIDAPGHADYIRAMVAGASGAQAALLVVSARAGVAAQTLEHLRIAALLGIERGIVVLSHCDGLPEPARAGAADAVRAALVGTGLQNAPLIACSAMTGEGLETVHESVAALIDDTAPPAGPPMAALPIDRVFTVPGRGVVVTGTLLGAALETGQALVLQPGGRAVTLRGLQSRGAAHTRVEPGARVAANLRGIAADQIAVGDVLCAPGGGGAALAWDVEIAMLPGVRPLKHMQQIRVLIGTATAVARVRLITDPNRGLAAGARALARVQFDSPQIAHAGQRAVLRHLSPAQTLGGAVVLDPDPPAGRARDRLAVLQAVRAEDIRALVAAFGAAPLKTVARLVRIPPDAAWAALAADHQRLGDGTVIAQTQAAAWRAELLADVRAYHAARPLHPVAPRRTGAYGEAVQQYLETALAEEGLITRAEDGIALAGHDPLGQMPQEDRDEMVRIEDRLRDGGARPPDLSDLTEHAADLLALLLRAGRAVRLHNVGLDQWIVFHAAALDGAARTLRACFPPPVAFRTGDARAALGTSRKFIVPLLEHFDHIGITRRTGTLRQMRD